MLHNRKHWRKYPLVPCIFKRLLAGITCHFIYYKRLNFAADAGDAMVQTDALTIIGATLRDTGGGNNTIAEAQRCILYLLFCTPPNPNLTNQ